MSETHKPFRPTEPSSNWKGANVVSRYFRIGKSNAQIKKKERRSTHDHKATKHIQLRERWQFVDNCYTEACGENECLQICFNKPSVKARGVIEKFIRISVENAMFHVKRK